MFELPPLGYDYGALEPFVDAKTMEIHYSKHHQAYVDNLNKALASKGLEAKWNNENINDLLGSLNKIPADIRTTVRNNAGGHANHTMFWGLMKNPGRGKTAEPSAFMKGELTKAFGTYENFVTQFKSAGMGRFGSGWGWLILNSKTKKLEIISTANQDSPIMDGNIPLLAVDVWEHAYYLLHQNMRASWLDTFFKIINWEQVEKNYQEAIARKGK